jgi:hypothetical protein
MGFPKDRILVLQYITLTIKIVSDKAILAPKGLGR